MKEFKGTQGEWKIKSGKEMNGVYTIATNENEICTIWDAVIQEETNPNTNLIAAAPDMLKVLQKILEYNLEEVYPGFNKDTGIEEVINKALE